LRKGKRREKILIIEDTELNRDLLVQILEEDYETFDGPQHRVEFEI
jgi:CheY-like chemotaxis protein